MYTRKLKGMSRMVVPVLICVLVLRLLENSSQYQKKQTVVRTVIGRALKKRSHLVSRWELRDSFMNVRTGL